MSLSCLQCKREFTLKSNLTRHLRMVHNLDVQRIDILPADFDVYQYKCLEGCEISFKYNRDLRLHLRLRHGKELVELNLEFPNFQEFTKWLHNEETENCVQYVHMTAMKKKSTGVQTYYYECSRSGKRLHVDDSIRKRKSKKQGTLKLNRGCTSQIIANQFLDGTFNVNYFKTHYGHDNEIEHLKLSKRERGAIASKLLLGIPVTTVLNSVQNNKSGSLKRINLLRRKDVSNIKRSFNIDVNDCGTSTLSNNVNINAFIEECSQEESNPILYTNLKEITALEGICLMIMTKYQAEILQTFTKNNNALIIETVSLENCDFELTMLFLLFNHSEIFPVACMFSTNKDLYTYELFFNKIRERIGQLSPEILYCNVDKIYYEAWRIVMGDVNHIFYIPNQIDLDWKLNLNRITCKELLETKVKREWVYNTLKDLESTIDENDFFETFEETVRILHNDEEFKDFLNCFLETYSDPKRWANCYKQNLNIDESHFETIQQTLENYIEKHERFDKIFYSLIRLIRDETINYIKKTISVEVLVIENDSRHNLDDDDDKTYHFEDLTANIWNVIVDSTTYTVQRHLKNACCDLICSICNICTHCFSCTCTDYFLNNLICTHIHLLWMTYFHGNDDSDDDDDDDVNKDLMVVDDNNQSEEIIIKIDGDGEDDDDDHSVEQDEVSIDELQQEITDKANILCSNLHNIGSVRSLKFVLETLTNLCDFVMKDDDIYTIEEESVTAESLNDSVNIDHSYL